MCGPSAAQTTVQQDQLDLTKQIMAQNSSTYSESQGILNSLNAVFQPILENGPNQTGFSQAEDTSLNTEATEQTARNYASAEKALNDNMVAAGGGNNFIPSGAAAANKQALAATAAGTLSGEQNTILQQNYATGRQNFMNAAGTLSNAASTLNPVGTADAATSASTAAGNTANTIAAQGNSVWTSVFGALGGIAGQAVGATGMPTGAPSPTTTQATTDASLAMAGF
jgi:hypothetical protein